MNELLVDLLMVLDVNMATQDHIHALMDQGAVVETRGIDAWYDAQDEILAINETGGTYQFPPLSTPPQLVVTGLDRAPDAFISQGNITYYSARLRAALDLAEGSVVYLPVDDSLSDPEIQAADYQIVQFPNYEAAADEARSERDTWDAIFGPGTEAHHPNRRPFFKRIVLKADFRPKTEVFHIAGSFERPYALPALAERISGFPDIELRDTMMIDYQ